ncbi:MAG: hypothetical protein ACJ8AW_15125 [Rhodopila sp.]
MLLVDDDVIVRDVVEAEMQNTGLIISAYTFGRLSLRFRTAFSMLATSSRPVTGLCRTA